MITYLNRVAVRERQDGSISITRFSVNDIEKYGYQNEDDFIAWYMNRLFPGESYTLMSEDDIPKDTDGKWDRSKRGKWRLQGGKVKVDNSVELPEEAKEKKTNAAKEKLKALGLTDEDLEVLIK